MKIIALVLAVLFIGSAEAKPQKYWTCVDAEGNKSAQDFPCPEPLDAAPAQAEMPTLNQAPVQQAPIAPAKRKPVRVDYIGIMLKPLLPLFAMLVVALLAIFAIKAGLAKKRSSKPKHRSYTSKKPAERIEPSDDLLKEIPLRSSTQKKTPSRATEWSLDLMRTLEWKRFEELCEGFWKAKGYPAQLTAPGADGGIDVVIQDRTDANAVFAIIQCKAWNAKQVGVETVRALWGAKDHFKAKLAIFYGLSGFSADAQSFASEKHLKLVSGEELLTQIKGLSAEQQRELLSHVTRGDYTTPTCAQCDVKMVERSEGKFWGCVNFPKCRNRLYPRAA
ncbi:MAG: restriction endonuclease [Pseudomonadota bacterium]